MRSVTICLLSFLFVPALGAPTGNQGQPSHPPSHPLPPVHQLATHEPLIHLAPIKPPSTRPSSTHLPSIHQLPIHQPSTHQPPTRQNLRPIRPRPPPSVNPPPPHGHIVAFQGNTGRHAGIILGSQPDQQRKFKVAPVNIMGHDPAVGPVLFSPHNQVVKVHQDDLVDTKMRAPNVASHLMRQHAQHPPTETHATAPVYGSRNYAALHGSGTPAGGRRRR
ncbi:hypothetical protein JOM56_012425 [Amanita muscaria]